MIKRIIVALSAVTVFASGVGACLPGPRPTPTAMPSATPTAMPSATPTAMPSPTPTPTPFPLQTPGWGEVTVHGLCLEVEQSYPEIEGKEPEPIAETVQYILAGIGVEVVAEGAQCDATLTVTLTAQALGAPYVPAGFCYTGAEAEGQMRLAVPGREPFTVPSSGSYGLPSTISGCPSQPREAPFWKAWSQALFDGLAQLWGLQVLIQALGDTHAGVGSAAADALREIGPEEAVPALIQALEDEHADVRRAAADALEMFGPEAKEAVPALIQALGDEDKMVRWAAADALGKIGPEEAVVPALIEALGDEDSDVRAVAADALRMFGPEAKEAVPALIEALGEALGDEGGYMRAQATLALWRITGQHFGEDAAAWQEWWEEQE